MIPFKIKIIEKPHSFAPRPLLFKLQQEALKFNDICVSWGSPKTELVTDFLNLEKVLRTPVFLNSTFPLLNNLFISFLNLFISLIELKNIH